MGADLVKATAAAADRLRLAGLAYRVEAVDGPERLVIRSNDYEPSPEPTLDERLAEATIWPADVWRDLIAAAQTGADPLQHYRRRVVQGEA